MSQEKSDDTQKTCFVIMGFGKKTDYQSKPNRVLDLDASYHNMIKPAVEDAGLKCIRADEIKHSGIIDVPMYQQLLKADLVIADLSTYNCNAFYELGVRHALRPFSTITIAEEKLIYPFDVGHVAIRRYKHLGEDIGASEARRFSAELKEAIKAVLEAQTNDSPVYEFLKNEINPPSWRSAEAESAVDAVAKAASAMAEIVARQAPAPPLADGQQEGPTLSELMLKVDAALKDKSFVEAKKYLTELREVMKPKDEGRAEDDYIIQRLALATYKSKQPTPMQALEDARDLLAELNPKESIDSETLGLWGAVHKRLWETTEKRKFIDEAVRGYERGFYLLNDYYNGINFAYLLNVRAAERVDADEAITDFVTARRVRQQVVPVCEKWLAEAEAPDEEADDASKNKSLETRYWVLATLGEAYVGLGDEAAGSKWLEQAYAMAPQTWMKDSTEEQLGKLRKFLEDSPLKRVAEG